MRIHNVTFDADDPMVLSAFWSAVLGRPVAPGANAYAALIERTETAPAMLFRQVPEGNAGESRLALT